jgi:hypothetical protein
MTLAKLRAPRALDQAATRGLNNRVKPNRRTCAVLARKRMFADDTTPTAMRKYLSFAQGLANG